MLNKIKKYLRYLFHIGCHYIVWPICVLSAAKGYLWLGFILSVVITSVQFCLEVSLKRSKNLLIFIVTLTLFGFIFDSLFLNLKFIDYHANPFSPHFAPPWISGVWINFAVTIFTCARYYFKRYIILAILSAVGFPLAYWAGIRLGAASLMHGNVGLIMVGITWGIMLPTILYFFDKILPGRKYA